VIAVLDLDSPVFGRFDEEDAAGLNALVEKFVAVSDSLKERDLNDSNPTS